MVVFIFDSPLLIDECFLIRSWIYQYAYLHTVDEFTYNDK